MCKSTTYAVSRSFYGKRHDISNCSKRGSTHTVGWIGAPSKSQNKQEGVFPIWISFPSFCPIGKNVIIQNFLKKNQYVFCTSWTRTNIMSFSISSSYIFENFQIVESLWKKKPFNDIFLKEICKTSLTDLSWGFKKVQNWDWLAAKTIMVQRDMLLRKMVCFKITKGCQYCIVAV